MTHRIHPAFIAGLALTLTLVLAACTGGGSDAAPTGGAVASSGSGPTCVTSTTAGTVDVSIKDFAFAPAQVTAKVGDVVAFTNGDSTTHTATLDDGACDSGRIAAGGTAGLEFERAGSYPFHCAIHPSMKGTITVS